MPRSRRNARIVTLQRRPALCLASTAYYAVEFPARLMLWLGQVFSVHQHPCRLLVIGGCRLKSLARALIVALRNTGRPDLVTRICPTIRTPLIVLSV